MRRSTQKKHKIQRCQRRRRETLIPNESTQVDSDDEAAICKDKAESSGFFGCYLLTSLCPRYKGHSYIGFTVNPKRRIRQHNGEITSGAFRTKRKRPWEMVLCIHGFPTRVAALQFEWAWQHPKESLAVREAASTFKSLRGLANKIKLGLTMLTLQSWQSMDLTVSFFSTEYMKHTAGCPNLPRQMKTHFCSMDELPCYWDHDHPYGCDDDGIDPNHIKESAFLSDDRQASSIDGIMDASHFSIDIERCNIQNVSEEHIWAWDQRSPASKLWEEPSTVAVNATVEDKQLMQSRSADIRPENKAKEQVGVIKEISTQELTQSFHQTHTSDKEFSSHLLLDEELEELHCHTPAGILRSAGSNMNRQKQRSKEMGNEGQRGPSDKEFSSHLLEVQTEDLYCQSPTAILRSASGNMNEEMQLSKEMRTEVQRDPSDKEFSSHLLLDEEMEELYCQSPIGIFRSAGSKMTDHIRLTKEMGTQGQRDPYDKEFSSHLLEEEMEELHCQFPAGILRSAGGNMNEKIQLSKVVGTEGRRDPFPSLEYLTESFEQAGPSMGESSSKVSGKFGKKDDMTCIQLPVRLIDDQPSSMEGIEIIDLSTPSPECGIISGGKKRRAAHVRANIIDLTRSPPFVQL